MLIASPEVKFSAKHFLIKISPYPLVLSLHSSLLFCIVAVVLNVIINKNSELKLPAMMRQQID